MLDCNGRLLVFLRNVKGLVRHVVFCVEDGVGMMCILDTVTDPTNRKLGKPRWESKDTHNRSSTVKETSEGVIRCP